MAQNISKNFSRIGENIKKIRQAKKLSQADFAELFNLARPSVGAYEEGRSEPKIDTIIQIANYFRISIDVLLTRKLTISEIYSFDQLNRTLDKVHKSKGINTQPTQKVTIIRNNHYLDYIVNREKNDYLSQLEHVTIPRQSGKTLRIFEMNGSEMTYNQQGLRHGDLIAAEWLDINELPNHTDQVMVLVYTKDIVIKRIKNSDENNVTLKSDDPNYKEEQIELSKILEAWKPLGAFTTTLAPPTNLEERMLKMEKIMAQLSEKN
jgi:transcriptional regulator with XRE-family HTH domain